MTECLDHLNRYPRTNGGALGGISLGDLDLPLDKKNTYGYRSSYSPSDPKQRAWDPELPTFEGSPQKSPASKVLSMSSMLQESVVCHDFVNFESMIVFPH